MTCYSPLQGYSILNQKTQNGKQLIVFKENQVKNRPYTKIDLPCNQCIGCRIDRSREWAIRCVHEAQQYENNCFITLTFDDDNINENGILDKTDFQKFIKELRRRFLGKTRQKNDGTIETIDTIRYFHCGEYGHKFTRPHHHACLFNFDFPDKQYVKTEKGHRWYNSEILAHIWKKGFHSIGDVTFESAAYIAKYILKKITGKNAQQHYKKTNQQTGQIYNVEPEYITMSRRPGLGKNWFDNFKHDLYPKDYITENGKIIKAPKYYDKMYEATFPTEMNKIRQKRRKENYDNREEKTIKRLIVKHKIRLGQQRLYERTFEE